MAYNDDMLLMIQKIRALTEDFVQNSTEVFTYETSGIFTLAEPRIAEIVSVLINGAEPVSAEWTYDFDADTNKLTITNPDFASGDVIEVTYSFSKTSNGELVEYIRAALVWLSIYSSEEVSYKISTAGTIIPSPSAKTLDLICLLAAILIKPDYISYKTGNMAVTYPTGTAKLSKEDKILETIQVFKTGIGVVKIIEYNSNC